MNMNIFWHGKVGNLPDRKKQKQHAEAPLGMLTWWPCLVCVFWDQARDWTDAHLPGRGRNLLSRTGLSTNSYQPPCEGLLTWPNLSFRNIGSLFLALVLENVRQKYTQNREIAATTWGSQSIHVPFLCVHLRLCVPVPWDSQFLLQKDPLLDSVRTWLPDSPSSFWVVTVGLSAVPSLRQNGYFKVERPFSKLKVREGERPDRPRSSDLVPPFRRQWLFHSRVGNTCILFRSNVSGKIAGLLNILLIFWLDLEWCPLVP